MLAHIGGSKRNKRNHENSIVFLHPRWRHLKTSIVLVLVWNILKKSKMADPNFKMASNPNSKMADPNFKMASNPNSKIADPNYNFKMASNPNFKMADDEHA